MYLLRFFEVNRGSNEVDRGAVGYDLGLSGHAPAGGCRPAGELPPIFRGGAVGVAQRCPMAAVAGRVGELEQRVQALLPLECARRLGGLAPAGGRRSGFTGGPPGQHGGAGTRLCGRGKKNSAAAEALGRSRGGFSTKVHAVTDALGNPLDFTLTGGQAADIAQAAGLVPDEPVDAVIADKAYDAEHFVVMLSERGIKVVIPPRANRTAPRDCDFHQYKERHLIECFFNKIKHYRRVFSRFEKTARNYLSFLRFVAVLIWLR